MYSNDDQTKKNFMTLFNNIFRRRKKRLLSEAEIEFQRYVDYFTYFYLLFIVIGIIYCFLSNISVHLCGVIFGILFCVMAGIYLFFFLRRKNFSLYKFFSIFGVIGFVLGIAFFFLNPNNESSYLLCFGLSIIVVNLDRLLELFYLFRSNDPSKIIFLLSSILSVSLGVFVVINPFSYLFYREILGIFAILFSIINLMQLSLLQKRISEFVNSVD